jgi:hypothetical protein
VTRDGRILGASYEGAGRFGQFAAYPGNCHVQIEVTYSEREDVSTQELARIESSLRKLAFPLSQAA